MAEENDDTENNENEDGAGKKSPLSGKKKLIIIILVGVLILTASIAGTLWMLGVFDAEGDEELMAESSSEEMVSEQQSPATDKPSPAMYFPIKPAFVVNFSSRGRQRYLQADVTIMTRDPDIFTAMQTHLPLVKNRLVMLFSGQVYEELQTDEGKELLRQKSREALQELMQQELGKQGVEEVLFTNFVMQ